MWSKRYKLNVFGYQARVSDRQTGQWLSDWLSYADAWMLINELEENGQAKTKATMDRTST
jgi:hypothetical protein